MFQVNQGLYVGKDYENGYLGYIAEDNLFAVVSIEEGMTKEQGKELLDNLKKQIASLDKITLTSLDAQVSEILVRANVPLNFSMAMGCIYNNILYLKTVGEGTVYGRRNKDFAQIITGDNRASGYLHEFDFFVLTNNKLSEVLINDEQLKKFVGYKKPKDIVNELYAHEYGEQDKGLVALFMEFLKESEQRTAVDNFPGAPLIDEKPIMSDSEPMEQPVTAKKNFIPNIFSGLRLPNSDRRKTFTFIGVIIVSLILIWSVVLGRQRQVAAERQKKITATKEVVSQKLLEAEDVAFLNLDRSLALIAEAHTAVNTLKKDLGSTRLSEVTDLEKLIKEQESKITKKEEKNYEEFYDLALEDKDAQGTIMSLDGEMAAILDTKNGAVYVLDLAKKSIERNSSKEVSSASLVGLYEDKLYFYQKGQGVFQFTASTKVRKVIENDSDWGSIVDLDLYNGNIYVLDKGKDEVYKYLVAEDGFSNKASYFLSGQSVDLEDATSLSIDSSVYIANGDRILKYTSGEQQDMKTSFPESDVAITKGFTAVDEDKLYAWDKTKGIIYILDKNGTFERQIQSGIIAKGTDFVVYDNAAYILVGQKIYKVDL